MNKTGLRIEKCFRCGQEWNVSRQMDLTGRVYICPVCAEQSKKNIYYSEKRKERRK